MSIHIDAFDRTGGNGSRTAEEDWLDENTTASENQWSSASTTFYMSDVPASKKNRFRDLYDAHHGKGDSNRSSELPRMRMSADADAYCSILELPEPLTERIQHILQNIDISSQKFGGKPYEKIILAVVTLVHDEHLSNQPPSAVQYDQRLIFDDTFRDLMEANSLGSKELRGMREQIRTKTDFF